MGDFRFKVPRSSRGSQRAPVIRLKASYYQTLLSLKRQTGLPLGSVAEQCIDYALEHMAADAMEYIDEEAFDRADT